MKKITSIVCVCFALLLIKNVSFAQATTGVNDKNIFTIDADAPKNTIGISTQQYETKPRYLLKIYLVTHISDK